LSAIPIADVDARFAEHRRVDALAPRDVAGCVFVLATMILGGGGSVAPLSELLTELVALLAGLFFLLWPKDSRTRPLPRSAMVLGALVIALPLLQLVPLPPAIWQALPGRGAEAAALALIGRAGAWMPWSIAPAMTLASLLSLLPPLVALALAATAAPRGRSALIAAIALGGTLSLVLGALQLADGDGRTWRIYVDNPGFLNGFQANRNAEVDVLLVAVLAAAVSGRWAMPMLGRYAIPIGSAFCAALALGCVMTGSRTGIALLLPVALLAVAILYPQLGTRRSALTLLLVGLAPLAVLGLALAARNQALEAVVSRFTFGRDVRLDLWQDTWTAIRASWPCGTGVGTFRIAFLPYERLAVVDATHPVRAHNEYLEFLLEGGIAAILVVFAAFVLFARSIAAAASSVRRAEMPQFLWALGTLTVSILHSFVDYPMRSMALASLDAIAAGTVFAIATRRKHDRLRGLTSA
jgi:O-antigen ligase